MYYRILVHSVQGISWRYVNESRGMFCVGPMKPGVFDKRDCDEIRKMWEHCGWQVKFERAE
jgi:hypothetical protein